MAYSKIKIPKQTAVKIASKGDIATIQIKRIAGTVTLFHGVEPTAPFDFDSGIKLTGMSPFSLGCELTADVYAVSSRDTVVAVQKD